MNNLSKKIKNELIKNGADEVEYASLNDINEKKRSGLDKGISILVKISPEIINSIALGPNKEYYYEYNRLNVILDNLCNIAAKLIKENGYRAVSRARNNIKIDYRDYSTEIPHKTIARKAGLGWIGKCALLINEKYGSAIRISSVLTNAPLEISENIIQVKCGNCSECVDNCPGEACSGQNWSAAFNREDFFNAYKCRNTAVKKAWNVSPGETHCGLCTIVCPWTKKYIEKANVEYNFPAVEIANREDLTEILDLQKKAYTSEAKLYKNFNIQPMVQVLDELIDEYNKGIILKVVENRKIVGSVRLYEENGNVHVGKLIVHPDYQNRGYGKKIMRGAEICYKKVRYEIFTGYKSLRNISIYEKLGYKKFKEVYGSDGTKLIYLEKIIK